MKKWVFATIVSALLLLIACLGIVIAQAAPKSLSAASTSLRSSSSQSAFTVKPNPASLTFQVPNNPGTQQTVTYTVQNTDPNNPHDLSITVPSLSPSVPNNDLTITYSNGTCGSNGSPLGPSASCSFSVAVTSNGAPTAVSTQLQAGVCMTNRPADCTQAALVPVSATLTELNSIAVQRLNPSNPPTTTTTINIGQAKKFTATAYYSDGDTPNISNTATWSSQQTGTASSMPVTFTSGGTPPNTYVSVTGGSTTIPEPGPDGTVSGTIAASFTSPQGTVVNSNNAPINVTNFVQSISVAASSPSILTNGNETLTATCTYAGGPATSCPSTLSWSIVTDPTGGALSSSTTNPTTFTPGQSSIAPGASVSVKVRATDNNPNNPTSVHGSTTFSVSNSLTGIAISPSNSSITAGQPVQFSVQCVYSNTPPGASVPCSTASPPTITWASKAVSGAGSTPTSIDPTTGVAIAGNNPGEIDTITATTANPAGGNLTGHTTLTVIATPQPTIASVSPNSGPIMGGTPVTITGTGFTGATAVSFGGISATGFKVTNNGTTITVASPAVGTPTPVGDPDDVIVETSGGVSTTNANDQFTYYNNLQVLSASPSSGFAGAVPVTVSGSGLLGVTGITIGATPVPLQPGTTPTDNSLTYAIPPNFCYSDSYNGNNCSVPGGGTPVQVTFSTSSPSNSVAIFMCQVSCTLPIVTNVSPNLGLAGTPVVITGVNLAGATAVNFDEVSVPAAQFTVVSGATINTTSPTGIQQGLTTNVTVTTSSGTSTANSNDQFTYSPPPPPTPTPQQQCVNDQNWANINPDLVNNPAGNGCPYNFESISGTPTYIGNGTCQSASYGVKTNCYFGFWHGWYSCSWSVGNIGAGGITCP